MPAPLAIAGIAGSILGVAGLSYAAHKSNENAAKEYQNGNSQPQTQQNTQEFTQNDDERNEFESDFSQNTPKSTGIPYYDEKLKNGTFTPQDAYDIQVAYGVKPTEYRGETKELTINEKKKFMDTMADSSVANDMLNYAVLYRKGNTGISGGVDRIFHFGTNQWIDTSDKNLLYTNLMESMAALDAKQRMGGKVTQGEINRSREMISPKLKSDKSVIEVVMAMKIRELNKQKETLQSYIDRGFRPPKSRIKGYNDLKNELIFLDQQLDNIDKGGKFDDKAWEQIMKNSGHFLPHAQRNSNSQGGGYKDVSPQMPTERM